MKFGDKVYIDSPGILSHGSTGIVLSTDRLFETLVEVHKPGIEPYKRWFKSSNLRSVYGENEETKSLGIQSEVEDNTVMNNPGNPGLYKCTLNDSTFIVLTEDNDGQFGTIVYAYQDEDMNVGEGIEMNKFNIIIPFEGKVTLSNGD